MTRIPSRVIAAAGAAAITLGLAACAGAPAANPAAPVTAVPTPPSPAPTPTVSVPVAPATAPPVREAVPPVGVSVSAAGIEVPVVPVGVDGRDFMELPEDPAVAGWYRFGPDPSSPEGRTVISAHVDAPAYPIGPFSRLRDLAAGTEVAVADAAGTVHRYAVQSVTNYRKTALPVQEIFARTGPAQLVLITCGGPFDSATGRYEDNVVVIAAPVG